MLALKQTLHVTTYMCYRQKPFQFYITFKYSRPIDILFRILTPLEQIVVYVLIVIKESCSLL